MSYSYQFRLEIIKPVTEQDLGIREVAKLHKIPHSTVIYWLKAFHERGLDGVKSPFITPQLPKIVKPKMKKKEIEIPEPTDFTATALNQKWVTDVTEFHVGQEKLYFSPLMDLANREVIAYNFATRPKFSLVKKMLGQGLSRLKPTECPIIHSDQGVLYGTAEWGNMLKGKAIQSMSRRGNCYDNAVIESFFAILKSECFYSRSYNSIAELQAEIEEYLVYYNQKRIKLGLKGLSPVQYRAQYLS